MNWTDDCTGGTDGENAICLTLQEGFDELYSKQDLLVLRTEQINLNVIDTQMYVRDILDNANHISFYLFIAIVFSVIYMIGRWLFRLISDVVLGW